MKTCCQCKEKKDKREFYNNQRICKVCQKENALERYHQKKMNYFKANCEIGFCLSCVIANGISYEVDVLLDKCLEHYLKYDFSKDLEEEIDDNRWIDKMHNNYMKELDKFPDKECECLIEKYCKKE